jgi:hypothetical protein
VAINEALEFGFKLRVAKIFHLLPNIPRFAAEATLRSPVRGSPG